MKIKKKTLRLPALLVCACACLCLAAVGCGGEAPEEEISEETGERHPSMINMGTGFTQGGKCSVTEGDSKGKSGTYDEDGWCCVDGGWTCVECDMPDGGSRCKDGAKLFKVKLLYPATQVKAFAP